MRNIIIFFFLLHSGAAGIGLAAILPVIHHLVSDSFVPSRRGQVFGVLGACQMLGGIVSIMFATNVSASSGECVCVLFSLKDCFDRQSCFYP